MMMTSRLAVGHQGATVPACFSMKPKTACGTESNSRRNKAPQIQTPTTDRSKSTLTGWQRVRARKDAVNNTIFLSGSSSLAGSRCG